MKNLGIYLNSLLIGVASAWIATVFIARGSTEPAATIVETSEVVQDIEVVEDATEYLDELTIGTGDTFWGLQFDGVLPCSKMLVRGGGHIVSFSLLSDPLRRSHFHIRKEKPISVYDRPFTVEVVGDDEIHVRRMPKETVVTTVAD